MSGAMEFFLQPGIGMNQLSGAPNLALAECTYTGSNSVQFCPTGFSTITFA